MFKANQFRQNHFADVQINGKNENDLISRNRTLCRKIGCCQWFRLIWSEIKSVSFLYLCPFGRSSIHNSWICSTKKGSTDQCMFILDARFYLWLILNMTRPMVRFFLAHTSILNIPMKLFKFFVYFCSARNQSEECERWKKKKNVHAVE